MYRTGDINAFIRTAGRHSGTHMYCVLWHTSANLLLLLMIASQKASQKEKQQKIEIDYTREGIGHADSPLGRREEENGKGKQRKHRVQNKNLIIAFTRRETGDRVKRKVGVTSSLSASPVCHVWLHH
jgi:hypothetical protein